jgi:putative acetyltransferase
MTADVSIAVENPDRPDIRALLAEADAFYASLYPPERNYLLDVASLQRPGVGFYVARTLGRAAGYGAIVRHDGEWGEIKRMYVAPSARGRGLGRRILDTLEQHARDLGLRVIRLETGIHQPEAIGLYRSAGFADIAAFGAYVPDPISIFLEKIL